MKLLLFSDLHCNVRAAQAIVDRSAGYDVLVGAGDFANARSGIEMTIAVLRQARCPAVLVPGNSESAEELSDACNGWDRAHVLHGSGVTLGGIAFYGVGGGIPTTPFGPWSYDFTEAEAGELLAACPDGAVLVSHSPPKGAVDVTSGGKSLGSTAVRAVVEAKRPLLVVCGHIHESAGSHAIIGSSPVVNAGPRGMEWMLSG